MIFIDANYLVAVALVRDALHVRARAWSATVRESLVSTDFVVCEFVNSLSAANARDLAHATLNWLHRLPRVRIEPATHALVEQGLEMHQERRDKEWSLTDCISFHVMRELEITRALTHDHHFEQAGFEALLRRDPRP